MTARIGKRDLLRMRLRAQLVDPVLPASGDRIEDAVAVVRSLLAVQAQDFAQALWAVARRARSSQRGDVLAALESGQVVRSLPMRGTLHFVPAEDLGWMLDLTAPRTLQAITTRLRGLGIDDRTVGRAERVALERLSGDGLSRAEFFEALERAGVSTEGQRGYHLILVLAQRQLVCWGPPRGTQQALVLTEQWIREPRRLDRDAAVAEYLIRYVTGHGPATVRDFAWWTKLPLADARAGLAAAGDALETVEYDGAEYLVAPEVAEAARPSARPSFAALPGFDEYLLGYQDRSAALDPEHADRIVPGANGIFLPIVVAGGEVVGTWRRDQRSREFALHPDHFVEASPARRAAFEREARRYARFMRG